MDSHVGNSVILVNGKQVTRTHHYHHHNCRHVLAAWPSFVDGVLSDDIHSVLYIRSDARFPRRRGHRASIRWRATSAVVGRLAANVSAENSTPGLSGDGLHFTFTYTIKENLKFHVLIYLIEFKEPSYIHRRVFGVVWTYYLLCNCSRSALRLFLIPVCAVSGGLMIISRL